MAERAGTRIRVLDVHTGMTPESSKLKPGVELMWGPDSDPAPDYNGYSWFQENDGRSVAEYGRCGWIRYEVIPELADAATLAHGRLFAALTKLGPRALLVLTEVAERLAKGAALHGDFADIASRNWDQEALEEDLDGLVYRTVGAMKRAGRL